MVYRLEFQHDGRRILNILVRSIQILDPEYGSPLARVGSVGDVSIPSQ